MIQLLNKFFVLVLLSNLVACTAQAPGKHQVSGAQIIGTGVGAGAGAALAANSGPSPGPITVIGTAAIVGALIGSSWGDPMDQNDKHQALQAIANGKSAHWQNPQTKTSYTVVPEKNYVGFDGNPMCRQFTATQRITEQNTKTIHRVACPTSQGSWELVH